MAQDGSESAPQRGLSSFASLLGSNAGTISSAPVIYSQQSRPDEQREDTSVSRKQQINPALRFQPTKRPQIQSQRKPKPAISVPLAATPSSKHLDSESTASKPQTGSGAVALAANPPSKPSLADFVGDDDDGFYAATQPRERGGRRSKKKRRRNHEEQLQNWDDIYDPSRPNDFNQYKGSDEQMREIAEWKDLLYRHRREVSMESPESDDDNERRSVKPQFAPPKSYSFAPPASLNTSSTIVPAGISDHQIGDHPLDHGPTASDLGASPPSASPPVPDLSSGIISRAPVLYNSTPSTQLEETDTNEISAGEATANGAADEPRLRTPGQKGFAQRMMERLGWEKGKGLGANENGIITPLAMQASRRKRLPDAQGGGWIGPAGMGKITGGKRAKGTHEEGQHGKMSSVVVMSNMLVGLDLQQELDEGSLMQEIGEELDKTGGRVERIYIDRYGQSGDIPVFAKFTNELSALRAVNTMDGRMFNGNMIQARYFDADRFEKGDYALGLPQS